MDHSKTNRLNLLIVEDSEDDALLAVEALRRDGFEPSWLRVDSAADMRFELIQTKWQLILADHRLPGFSAMEAFEIYRSFALDIPFIIVSGSMGEEIAVAAMKAGVHDYLMKGNLARLAPAVRRELRECESRRERAQAVVALRAAYSELATIYASAPVVLAVVDEHMHLERVNEFAVRLAGQSLQQIIGEGPGRAVGCTHGPLTSGGCGNGPECSRCALRLAVADTIGNGINHAGIDLETASSPGSETPSRRTRLLVSSTIITSEPSRKALICAQDVTPLKDAEESLQATVRELKAALAEKTVLLKEVHHRVKNNLAVISSLLGMRAEATKVVEVKRALEESQQRVASIALIHEHLYGDERLDRVNFADYARQLVDELSMALLKEPDRITVMVEPSAVELGVDRAVPCALIVNELITNALKHAFPNRRKGTVGVGCQEVAPNRLKLSVYDDGVGMAEDSGPRRPNSLGLEIVQILTRQLGGSMEVFHGQGTRFELTF